MSRKDGIEIITCMGSGDFSKIVGIDVVTASVALSHIQQLEDQVELLTNERDMLRKDHQICSNTVDELIRKLELERKINDAGVDVVKALLKELEAAKSRIEFMESCNDGVNDMLVEEEESAQFEELNKNAVACDLGNLIKALISEGRSNDELLAMMRP